MHPKILTRVIGNNGSHLQICAAILLVARNMCPLALIVENCFLAEFHATSNCGLRRISFAPRFNKLTTSHSMPTTQE